MRYTANIFRSLLLLISLMVFSDVASAQSSLIFSDTAGRRVEFTAFGTIVYPDRRSVSRGYEVVYGDNLRAWYLNSAFNSGIVPISLFSDQSTGQALSDGARVYVRAVVRTADSKLTITHEYIWRVGSRKIEAVVTVKNSSGASLPLREVSILTPPPATPNSRSCPCMPALSRDGSTVESSVVTSPSSPIYLKTTASYPALLLQIEGSGEVPGCDGIPDDGPYSLGEC